MYGNAGIPQYEYYVKAAYENKRDGAFNAGYTDAAEAERVVTQLSNDSNVRDLVIIATQRGKENVVRVLKGDLKFCENQLVGLPTAPPVQDASSPDVLQMPEQFVYRVTRRTFETIDGVEYPVEEMVIVTEEELEAAERAQSGDPANQAA